MSDTILRTLVWVTNDVTLLLKCSLIVIKCRGYDKQDSVEYHTSNGLNLEKPCL